MTQQPAAVLWQLMCLNDYSDSKKYCVITLILWRTAVYCSFRDGARILEWGHRSSAYCPLNVTNRAACSTPHLWKLEGGLSWIVIQTGSGKIKEQYSLCWIELHRNSSSRIKKLQWFWKHVPPMDLFLRSSSFRQSLFSCHVAVGTHLPRALLQHLDWVLDCGVVLRLSFMLTCYCLSLKKSLTRKNYRTVIYFNV